MFGNSPSLVTESLWQMPQACTLIRTVLGPGSGIGRSTISKGPFGRETCATRIVAIFPSSSGTWAVPLDHNNHLTSVAGPGNQLKSLNTLNRKTFACQAGCRLVRGTAL